MRITLNQLKRIIKEEVQAQTRKRRLREATRDPRNLMLDLEDLSIGGTLDLETFGGGDYDPGRLTITRVEDASLETGWDIDEDEGEEPFPLYTITDLRSDAESDPMPVNRIVDAVGEFAY
jgi:hypothetical protein